MTIGFVRIEKTASGRGWFECLRAAHELRTLIGHNSVVRAVAVTLADLQLM